MINIKLYSHGYSMYYHYHTFPICKKLKTKSYYFLCNAKIILKSKSEKGENINMYLYYKVRIIVLMNSENC